MKKVLFVSEFIFLIIILSLVTFNMERIKIKAQKEDIVFLDYDSLARYTPSMDKFKICNRGVYGTYYQKFKYTLANNSEISFYLYWNYYTETVYTPNGTDVALPSGTNPTTYFVLRYLNDLPTVVINDIIARNATAYNLIQTNADPTTSYNCHSFAWYSQNSSTNDTWIDNPAAYFISSDGSYEEVSTPRAGDIMCYYDNNGTSDESDDINLHSSIIIGLSGESSNNVCGNANMYNVMSKWGMEGLYTHRGDECPYTSSHGGYADYVKYYRPKIDYSCTLSLYGSTINKTFNTASPETNTHKYEMYELNVNYSKNYQITVSSSYPLNVRLYDCHMQAIINNPTNTYNNGTYSVLINPSLTTGIYYLRVCYQNLSNNGIIHTNIVCHNHSYTYTWVSYIQHRQSCVCGVTGLQAHIVSPDAYNSGQMYATCLLCGGNALVNNYNKSQNIYPSTINGSFMLPNGVIVIVEEDIEAYIEGTLVFNYPTSQTMNNSIGSIFRQKFIY